MILFAMSIPVALYHIYVYALPLVILAVLFGIRWKVGLWGNCLTLGCVLFSSLIAVGWWEDLAHLLAKQAPPMLFFVDSVAFWTLFLVSFAILDTLTRFLSRVKVKYAEKVESFGNGAVLLVLFLALYGTYLFVEEIGPVGSHRGDEIVQANTTSIQALRLLSAGNLSGFTQVNQFDSTGNFQNLHLQRRQAIMLSMQGENGTIRADGSLAEGLQRSGR